MKNKEIINKMTIEQKASLMSGKDFWQTQDIEEFNIKSMFLADGPHGVRKQAAAADHLGLNESLKATYFPTAVTLANTWNTEIVQKVGQALGNEAVALKVNVLLGPGTNIKRNPLCGRNFEYYSEDPYLSGKMVSSQIKGIQTNGISACVKHFAVNNQEERRLVIDTIVDEKGVSLKVRNTGKHDGSEVVQLYIGKKDSNIYRPTKELKGFSKVLIKKGETITVNIPFDDYTFRFFDIVSNKFQIEAGTYEIYVGRNVRDIELIGTIEKEGIKVERRTDLESYYSGNIKDVKLDEFENLLGHEAPNPKRQYIKRKRIVVDYNTTVAELKYARGWTGRFFSAIIRFAPKFLKFFGQRQLANTIYMGMYHQPMRGVSRMTNGMINWEQLNGLLIMFNGKFFKGFREFRRASSRKRKRNKLAKKAEKEGKKK